jgi:hypothetical protein
LSFFIAAGEQEFSGGFLLEQSAISAQPKPFHRKVREERKGRGSSKTRVALRPLRTLRRPFFG